MKLASLYHLGADRFFADWRQVTEYKNPKVIAVRHGSCSSLATSKDAAPMHSSPHRNGVLVGLLGVSLYQDEQVGASWMSRSRARTWPTRSRLRRQAERDRDNDERSPSSIPIC